MSEPVVVHSFPPQFPTDDSYLEVALAEFNYCYRIARNLPKQTFDELQGNDRNWVLGRAQRLKSGKALRSA